MHALADADVAPEVGAAIDEELDIVLEEEPLIDIFGTREHHEFTYGPTIEGVAIKRVAFKDGTKDYRRWEVTCPLANCVHFVPGSHRCAKRRNTERNQMRRHGIAEVYAFLGLWILHARDKGIRKEHIEYSPTNAEITAYCRDHGWA